MNRGVYQHAIGVTVALTTIGVIAGTVGTTVDITTTGAVTRRLEGVSERGCVGVGIVVTGAAAGIGGVDHLREGDALVLEGKPGDRDHAVGEEGALVHQ